jgi:hypothetical protein
MKQHPEDQDDIIRNSRFDSSKIASFLGKHIIIGITYVDHNDDFISKKQVHGIIDRINMHEGIVVILHGSNEQLRLPPWVDDLEPAAPGDYRFKSTGEVVSNPDYKCSWLVKSPPPD